MILICSAWNEESKYLNLNNKFEILNLGIGYLNAALRLERFIVENRDRIEKIVFIGTAGLISPEESRFRIDNAKIYSIKNSYLADYLSKLDYSYIPVNYQSYELESLEKFEQADALSSLEITKSASLSEQIKKKMNTKFALLENMELYGVVEVCSNHSVTLKSLLITTNFTNEYAHLDWKTNHEKASEILCATFIDKDFLHSL